jgi:hypothetical protein
MRRRSVKHASVGATGESPGSFAFPDGGFRAYFLSHDFGLGAVFQCFMALWLDNSFQGVFTRPSVTSRTLIGNFVRGGRYCALGGGLWADDSVNDPVWSQKNYVG